MCEHLRTSEKCEHFLLNRMAVHIVLWENSQNHVSNHRTTPKSVG